MVINLKLKNPTLFKISNSTKETLNSQTKAKINLDDKIYQSISFNFFINFST